MSGCDRVRTACNGHRSEHERLNTERFAFHGDGDASRPRAHGKATAYPNGVYARVSTDGCTNTYRALSNRRVAPLCVHRVRDCAWGEKNGVRRSPREQRGDVTKPDFPTRAERVQFKTFISPSLIRKSVVDPKYSTTNSLNE